MNFAFSTLGCPERTFDEVIQLAQKYSVPSVGIRTLEGSNDLVSALVARFGNPETAAGYSLPLRIASLDSSSRMLGGSDENLQELFDLAPWAEALDVPYLRVFDGRVSEGGSWAETIHLANTFIDRWRKERCARNWQVDIIVETHSSMTTSTRIADLQRELNQSVGILWDTHHTWYQGGEEPLKTWHSIKDWVKYIHVKDSFKPIRPNEKVRYTLPGCGDYPFELLLALLEQERFDGPVSLEWEKHWHPELPELAVALEACSHSGWC